MTLRERWEGVSLPGDYTLAEWLGGDDSAGLFQTPALSDGRRAVVKLIPAAAVDSSAVLDLWQRTRQLRHPNLVEFLDYGRADYGGEMVLYAVFEAPDDTLASALSQSPLNPVEAREVLDAVLNGVRYLHAQGLAHGALGPDNILAVGDRVKLSTDALREAKTSSDYRDDIRSLGEFWQKDLMPASSKSAEIAAHAADPNPETRWSLAEISAALDEPIPAPVETPPAVSAPSSILESVAAPVSIPRVSVPPVVARNDVPARPSSLGTSERADSSRFPKWIFVGIAALLLLILALNLRRSDDVNERSRVAPASVPAETPAAAPRPSPPTIRPEPPPAAPKPSASVGKEMWRVIAFTYRSREAAHKKVQQLNRDHPGLNASVFSPDEKKGYYLVSLGGRMTHEDAVRLQRRTRGKGLPRDLYVQNYSR